MRSLQGKSCRPLSLGPLIAAALLAFAANGLNATTAGQEKSTGSEKRETVTFKENIAPLLKEKCSPCHFDGGKVFDRYPFDRYETVRRIGRRLNSRLKGESADLVSRWIEIGAPEGGKKPRTSARS